MTFKRHVGLSRHSCAYLCMPLLVDRGNSDPLDKIYLQSGVVYAVVFG